MGFWLTRYMRAEGDEGIFRHPFAGKFSSYPLRGDFHGVVLLCVTLSPI